MNKLKIKKFVILFLILTISGTIIANLPTIKNRLNQQEIEKINEETVKEAIKEGTIIQETTPEEKLQTPPTPSLKRETNESGYLNVQFICQAPLQTVENWTYHEESCEEAALLMAYNYETNKTVTKEEANNIILDMIEWEKEHFGAHEDLYAEGMKKFATGYLNLKENEVSIIINAEISDIKNVIDQGHPVIVPITGEILQNPFYPYPGYHMLLVKGYTKDRIITNDNGTKRGEDYSYETEIFEKAMKDAGGDIIILKIPSNS
jgi:uncharacterized protein YvpB